MCMASSVVDIIFYVFLQNKIYFEQLKLYVYKYDLLVDTLIKKVL